MNAEVISDNLKNESSLINSPQNDRPTGSINKDNPSQELTLINTVGITENPIGEEVDLIDLHESNGTNAPLSSLINQPDNKDENDRESDKQDIQHETNLTTKSTFVKSINLVKTSCGDAHNVGLDSDGRAYSLPSPLDFNPFPSGSTHKVSSKYLSSIV